MLNDLAVHFWACYLCKAFLEYSELFSEIPIPLALNQPSAQLRI